MTAQPNTLHTTDEYFRRDQLSPEKLEYYAGVVVAQAGATARHNAIVTNIIGHLFPQVRERGCRMYPGDLRVQAVEHQVYTYPDVTIVCGEPRFLEPSEMTLLNPTLLIEILSPSTATRDRNEKLIYYRAIESLQEYILIDQSTPYVQRYSRRTPHFWYVHLIDSIDETVILDAVGCSLPMQAIYDGINIV